MPISFLKYLFILYHNHNIGFTSQQGKFVHVYVNGKWMVIDMENALSDIHRKSIELVRNKISDIDENSDTGDKYDTFKKINKINAGDPIIVTTVHGLVGKGHI